VRVGVIVSDIANPHFFGMVRGAGRQAAAADYSLGGPTDKAGCAAIELVLPMIREPGRPTADTRLVVPS
jgi:DNA-binding LacI/PurR family transcriptional regulator